MQRVGFRAIVLAGVFAVCGMAAHAQTPSADAIINGLLPKQPGQTRGIKPAKLGTPAPAPAPALVQSAAAAAPAMPPPAAAAPAVSAAPTESGAPSISLTVQFATGSTQLTPSAMHTLDELGKALSSAALSSYRFRIEGHTDTVGSPSSNLALSQGRAAAVVAYLSSRYGVSAERLEAVGRGSTELAVPTPAQTAEPRNRRVQVINISA